MSAPSERPCARCNEPVGGLTASRRFCRRGDCVRAREAEYARNARALKRATPAEQRAKRLAREAASLPPMPPATDPLPLLPIRSEPGFDVVWSGGPGLTSVKSRPHRTLYDTGALRRGGRSVLAGGA